MFTFLVLVVVLAVVLLVAVTAVRPLRSELSRFELERRAETDPSAKNSLRRERLLPDIVSLQRVLSALLLVLVVVSSLLTFEWLIGIIVSLVVALEYGALARLKIARKYSQKLYDKHEPQLLGFVEKFSGVLRLVRMAAPSSAPEHLNSKEELAHLVSGAGSLLSSDEKKLITNGIGFDERSVRESMTPRSVIESIKRKELLGPLVLDDLHKTGHSRFPVIDGDLDHIVGMLHIQDLLTLDGGKRSTTAEKTMEPRVFYVHENQSLQHALAAFLRTRHHLFVVVNEFRETVGLLSLEDVIEALLGRRIVDEFDAHEDLRVVAGRNLKKNNQPEHSTDV